MVAPGFARADNKGNRDDPYGRNDGVFTRHYDATPRRPRDYCRLCGELADFSIKMDAQGERMFTLEEWEAGAEVVRADSQERAGGANLVEPMSRK